jgi:hypothetical protein
MEKRRSIEAARGVRAIKETSCRSGPVPLFAARPDPRAEAEVLWFFVLAECEMGNRSNFAESLGRRANLWDHKTPEDFVEAAHKHRRIQDWLRAMPSSEAGVLQAAYDPRCWPRVVLERFGRIAGVAVRMMCAEGDWPEDRRSQEQVEMKRARELEVMCMNGQRDAKTVRDLRNRATDRLERALRAYTVARKGSRWLVRPE